MNTTEIINSNEGLARAHTMTLGVAGGRGLFVISPSLDMYLELCLSG